MINLCNLIVDIQVTDDMKGAIHLRTRTTTKHTMEFCYALALCLAVTVAQVSGASWFNFHDHHNPATPIDAVQG